MRMGPSTLDTISVSLTRSGESVLFLQVDRDGRCKRVGDGAPGSSADYVSSVVGPEVFLALQKVVPPELFERSGCFALPEPVGDEMLLSIRFFGARQQHVVEFQYGADSAPPPATVQHFVSMAVALTDEWYLQDMES